MLKKKLGLNAIELNWWSNKNLTTCFKIPSTLIIPEECRWIGGCAFWCCERLKEVIIPESVQKIRYNAFYCCRNLREVKIPESIKEFEEGAFSRCRNLREVIIPENVEKIDFEAFCKCSNATIILRKPEWKFKYIGDWAFDCCKSVNVKEEVRK